MEFHPKDLPISKTYDLKDERDALKAVEDMINLGFKAKKEGYRVLMPKEPRTAKRIGYTVTTSIATGLRRTNQDRDIKYWTYNHDDKHYALVLIHGEVLRELGL